jgi:hypothetical protein
MPLMRVLLCAAAGLTTAAAMGALPGGGSPAAPPDPDAILKPVDVGGSVPDFGKKGIGGWRFKAHRSSSNVGDRGGMLRGADLLDPPLAGHGNSLPVDALAAGGVSTQGVLPPGPAAALVEEAAADTNASENANWTVYSHNYKDDPSVAKARDEARTTAQQKAQVQNLVEHMKQHLSPRLRGEDGAAFIETASTLRDGACTTVHIHQCFGGMPYSASVQVAGVSRAAEIKQGMEQAVFGILFPQLRDSGASDADMELIRSVLCSAIVPPCRTSPDCAPRLCCNSECKALQTTVFTDLNRGQLSALAPGGSLRAMVSSVVEGSALTILDRALEVLTDADCKASGAFATSDDCTDARIVVSGQTCGSAASPQLTGGEEAPDENQVDTRPEHVISSEEIEREAAENVVGVASGEASATGLDGEAAEGEQLAMAATAGGHPMPRWASPTEAEAVAAEGNVTSQGEDEKDEQEEEAVRAKEAKENAVAATTVIVGARAGSGSNGAAASKGIEAGSELDAAQKPPEDNKKQSTTTQADADAGAELAPTSSTAHRAVFNSAADAETEEEAIAHAIRAETTERAANTNTDDNVTKAEAAALQVEAVAMREEEATLAGEMRTDGGNGAFIEPAFSRSESQAIESTLSDRGQTDAHRAVGRSRSDSGQFEWVGKASAGSNAIGTFAKVQPRYTHEQANEILASKTKK